MEAFNTSSPTAHISPGYRRAQLPALRMHILSGVVMTGKEACKMAICSWSHNTTNVRQSYLLEKDSVLGNTLYRAKHKWTPLQEQVSSIAVLKSQPGRSWLTHSHCQAGPAVC